MFNISCFLVNTQSGKIIGHPYQKIFAFNHAFIKISPWKFLQNSKKWSVTSITFGCVSIFFISWHISFFWRFIQISLTVTVHGCVMVLNVIGGLALLFQFGDFTTFGVGLLYLVLFTPISFLCWYRPAYKAFRYLTNFTEKELLFYFFYCPIQILNIEFKINCFRSDSSFNFMVFFFVFFFQFLVTSVFAIGIAGTW